MEYVLRIDGDHETLNLILTYFKERGWENRAMEESWGYNEDGFIQVVDAGQKTYGTWCFETEGRENYKHLTKEEFLNKYCPELDPNWTPPPPPTIEEVFKF